MDNFSDCLVVSEPRESKTLALPFFEGYHVLRKRNFRGVGILHLRVVLKISWVNRKP